MPQLSDQPASKMRILRNGRFSICFFADFFVFFENLKVYGNMQNLLGVFHKKNGEIGYDISCFTCTPVIFVALYSCASVLFEAWFPGADVFLCLFHVSCVSVFQSILCFRIFVFLLWYVVLFFITFRKFIVSFLCVFVFFWMFYVFFFRFCVYVLVRFVVFFWLWPCVVCFYVVVVFFFAFFCEISGLCGWCRF